LEVRFTRRAAAGIPARIFSQSPSRAGWSLQTATITSFRHWVVKMVIFAYFRPKTAFGSQIHAFLAFFGLSR
jgi:hypothetical protein